MMTTLEQRLHEEYPDGVIRNISENKELYYQIRKVLPYVQFPSVKSYLRSLGFVIERESQDELRKEIERELSELFPDGIVESRIILGTPLYTKMRKYNTEGLKMNELFERFGYEYSKQSGESQYDYFTLQKLSQEYIPSQRDIVRLLDINRGTINNIVHGKVNPKSSGASWQITFLEDFEEELLMKCILEKSYMITDGNTRLSIHNNGMGKVAIVIKSGDTIRVLFNEDVPEYLRRHMDRQGLTYLFDYEKEFLSSCTLINVLGKQYVQSEDRMSSKWNSVKGRGMRARNLSEEDYFTLIGVYGIRPYDFSDEAIIEVLSRNADEEGTVAQTNKEIAALNRRFRHYKFEMNDPEYQQFENWEEYIESFGYHMRGVHGISQEVAERVKRRVDERNTRLLENHVVCGKRKLVFIPSSSDSYRKIYNAYKTRGFANMAEYVEYLGYQMCSARRENGTIVIAS